MSNLAEIFDVEPVEVVNGNTSVTVAPEGEEDADYLYARARHYEISEAGSEAIQIAMRIARETENPKAIEALSGLLKNLSDVNKTLLVLNKDKAEVKTAKGKGGATPQIGTQQNFFVGNSRDLNKMIATGQINASTDTATDS